MSDKRRGITRQKIDKKLIKDKENNEKIDNLTTELINQDFRTNLKARLDEQVNELAKRLNELEEGQKLSVTEIKAILSRRKTYGVEATYSPAEIGILFDYYKDLVIKINKHQQFIPTKANFCGFIGITSATYSSWQRSDDLRLARTMQMIDDFLADVGLSSAQNGDIKEISTIFRMKSEHGYVEANAPIVVEHRNQTNLEEIRKNIAQISKGKSLKTIELKKNENGVYEEEN